MNSILILDDEEIDCFILSKLIEQTDCTGKIVKFHQPILALDYLESKAKSGVDWPTHLFIDINMPVMDGFKFIKEYTKIPLVLNYNAKLYILSSSSNPDDKKQASNLAIISEFITKPISLEILNRLLINR